MNFKLGANAVTAVIYQMLKKHSRYRNKDQAFKWCIHINLFLCTQNTRESTPQVQTHFSILTDWKKFVQKFCGQHCTQEETTCLLGEMIICRVPIMCFRGICITARSLVRYGRTGEDGCVWWWVDLVVWCWLGIEDWWWNGRASRWQVWINGRRWKVGKLFSQSLPQRQ